MKPNCPHYASISGPELSNCDLIMDELRTELEQVKRDKRAYAKHVNELIQEKARLRQALEFALQWVHDKEYDRVKKEAYAIARGDKGGE